MLEPLPSPESPKHPADVPSDGRDPLGRNADESGSEGWTKVSFVFALFGFLACGFFIIRANHGTHLGRSLFLSALAGLVCGYYWRLTVVVLTLVAIGAWLIYR